MDGASKKLKGQEEKWKYVYKKTRKTYIPSITVYCIM